MYAYLLLHMFASPLFCLGYFSIARKRHMKGDTSLQLFSFIGNYGCFLDISNPKLQAVKIKDVEYTTACSLVWYIYIYFLNFFMALSFIT